MAMLGFARPCTRFTQLSLRRSTRHYIHSRVGFNDYDKGHGQFKLEAPIQFNFCRDMFDVWAKKPDLTALWWIDDHGNDRKYSYQLLSQLSKRLANGLQHACRLKRGDRVLVILPRVPEWWMLTLALVRSGLVFCPGTTLLTSNDIAWRIRISSIDAVIVGDEDVYKIEEISEEFPDVRKICVTDNRSADGWYRVEDLINKGSPDHECVDTRSSEVMNLYFTSGTTGSPKMALHTHASYGLAHVATGRYWLDLTAKDIIWSNNDTGWAKTAYSNTFGPWSMGATVFTHHTAKFDPEVTLKVVSDYPITTLCQAPTGYRFLVQQNMSELKLPFLTHAVSAGEPLNPEVMEAWRTSTGLQIYEGYGQTETVLLCGNYKCLQVKPGSMGKAAPGFKLEVVDSEGNVLGAHEEGNLAVSVSPHRPVGLFAGYLDDEAKTESVYNNGYYLTGDRAYIDEEGYTWFVGRSDDVIISSSYRIGPFEVESALQEHPAVLESAAVASPHATRGQIVKAYVVLTEGAKHVDRRALTEELQNHVKSLTAPYKYPRQVEYVDQLPKTVSGKTRRVELRERELQRHRDGSTYRT